MLKVLHAAETIKGGVASVINGLMTQQEGGGQISQLALLVPLSQIEELRLKDNTSVFTFHRSGRNFISLIFFAIAFAKALRRMKPDVVHLHSTFAGVIGRVLCLFMRSGRNARVVYCPHGWSFFINGSAAKRRIFGFVERRLAAISNVIVCVSKYEADSAIDLGVDKSKIVVVYNGVVPDETAPEIDSSEGGRIKVLFVGRFDRQKGFDVLMEAMAMLEGEVVDLTVVGGAVLGDSGNQTLNLPNIRYLNWMKPKDLVQYYRSADVIVVPSRWEGFAMVPLEAMANKRAVFASNVTSLPEAVLDGVTGRLFPEDDPKALVDLLKNTSKESLRTFGANGFAHLSDNFTQDLMNKKTLEAYSGSRVL
jgi:glycosyltransferase involved in cell wall biosynthesis